MKQARKRGVFLVLLAPLVLAAPARAGIGAFADCVRRSGAVLYSAPWCSRCRDQLALFGEYAGRLKREDCYTRNSDRMLGKCKDAKIEGFPTWVFRDGSRIGYIPLDDLARRTGCKLK